MATQPTIIKKLNNSCAVIDDKIYDIESEARGKRPKFWINGKLFKQNLNESALEAEAEVLASVIAESVGYPAVKYSLAEMQYQNQTYKGVLSEDYRNMFQGEVTEYSGKTIMDIYRATMYDNARGKSISPANTIDFYTTAISSMFRGEKQDNIRSQLLGLATLDYVFSQSDRHMYNVCFLKDDNGIHVAPTFDNGAMCLFNYGSTKLANIAQSLAHTKEKNPNNKQKVNNFLNHTVHSDVMLGIHTPTSVIVNDESTGNSYNNFVNDTALQDQFLTELAYESSSQGNPIYDRLMDLDMDEVFAKCEDKGCVLDDNIKGLVKSVYDCRMDNLDRTMHRVDKTYIPREKRDMSKGEE